MICKWPAECVRLLAGRHQTVTEYRRIMPMPLRVAIPHALDKAEARRRIETGFLSIQQNKLPVALAAMLSVQQHWDGDRMHFNATGFGQNVTGWLDVLPREVQIEVVVPGLLSRIAERILGAMKTKAQKLLE